MEVGNIIGNNIKTFNTLYQDYLSYIIGQTITNTKQEVDAEDVRQLIYLKMWQAVKKGIKINITWIIKTTKATLIDYKRDNKWPDKLITAKLEERYPTTKITENPVSNHLYNKTISKIKDVAEKSLTKSQKEIIDFYISASPESRSYKAIGNKLKIKTSQVRDNLHSARVKLRREVL